MTTRKHAAKIRPSDSITPILVLTTPDVRELLRGASIVLVDSGTDAYDNPTFTVEIWSGNHAVATLKRDGLTREWSVRHAIPPGGDR